MGKGGEVKLCVIVQGSFFCVYGKMVIKEMLKLFFLFRKFLNMFVWVLGSCQFTFYDFCWRVGFFFFQVILVLEEIFKDMIVIVDFRFKDILEVFGVQNLKGIEVFG